MAPHAGFDTEHVRERGRKDLLYLLEGVRGKKNLVIERSLAGPVGLIAKVATLHDYGVDKFFFLETDNVDTSQRNVVFMARGECARHAQAIAEQVKRLQRESQTGHEFHIFWVPRRTMVSDRLLEEAGVLGDVSIAELPLYFFPLERDVLSLELGDSFRDLFLFKDTTPAFIMAKALMDIQSRHGLFPRVIGKGDNAKRVADLLARMRQEVMADEGASDYAQSGLTPSNTIESVIIIDREVDLVTPLLTQLTYEGLIDEVWGIQNNLTDVDSNIVGVPPQQGSSQAASDTPAAAAPSRKSKVQLDSSDKLYDGLRDTNFAIVGTLLNKVARRLQSDYDSRHGSTTAELKDFVRKLPGYKAEQQNLKVHTGLAAEIMEYTRTDQFSRLLEVQQNLAAGADPSSQYEAIEELVARDMPLPEVLRLLCIYSCISGGIKSKDFDQFRRLVLEGYGYQHLLTLHNLEKLQLFLSRSSPMANMIPMTGAGTATGKQTNYTYLRKQLRLIMDDVDEHNPNDIAYVYSGYAPLSIRLVQCVLQKQYLLSITRGNGVGATASGAQGWRGFDEAAKHARGPTFDESQKGEDKAVKARALLSGGSDKKTVFVVFVGGITFTEIAALRFIAKKEEARRNVVICTTSIINGNRMMEAAIEAKSFAKDNNNGQAAASYLHTLPTIPQYFIARVPPPTTTPSALIRDTFHCHNTDYPVSRSTPGAKSEIVVRMDDMDLSRPSQEQAPSSKSNLLGLQNNDRHTVESSVSDRSELSSPPSSLPASSKATTPIDLGVPKAAQALPALIAAPTLRRRVFDVRPRVSIPTDVAPSDYANQCIAAAESSRLNPYALHQHEYRMLREHISYAQVTTYLNIRNGILRLWINNPRIGVAREEAIGCAKDARWFDVANLCYDWLVRSGYINFGAAEVPSTRRRPKKTGTLRRPKTIVVIGAGMSGLGCARQLDSLSKQYAEQFQDLGEEAPRVIVLEGRGRLGGRVYSRALDRRRHSVECGGMIITGFERGNPLNVLVRGQMGLPFHALRPETTLYDSNGRAVDEDRDHLVEKLFNDCLERVSDYKFKNQPSKLIEGNRDLMDEGRDSSAEVSEQNLGPQVNLVPVSTDRATGKTHVEPGTPATLKAAFKARMNGWAIKEGATEDLDLDLDAAAKAPDATLGSSIVDLTAQDFRLINWHVANLEYSNATNYGQMSIGGWDIDAGNEWEGKHTMIMGGYQNVPMGLAKSAVKKIFYNQDGSHAARVECEDGSAIEADYVVSSIPLGVLKHSTVAFGPPLPASKTEAIGRLGFGILNKIILVYDEAFWDTSRDIFGCLRTPTSRHSLKQSEYASQRGRCFQWFNVSNTSGMPVLLALMAGDAGFDTEHTKNDELVAEATEVLRSVFGAKVPQPVHSIVTRWGSDRFARGSYSFAGPSMQMDDYKEMAKPVGNLFFAGEHTTDTHPATVHGAYLMLGPIQVPLPLIPLKDASPSVATLSPRARKQAKIDAYEGAALQHIKVAGNAYLLYSKAHFEAARKRCEEGRRPGKGRPGPNEVRVMTSKMWKEAAADERRPFEDQASEQKRAYHAALQTWEDQAKQWDQRYVEVRAEYEREHKLELDEEEAARDEAGERRRARAQANGGYAESEGSDVETLLRR
ncbi:vacuolar protein sorting 33A-like protein [Xylariaceae sp. FL0804]|nr:vacuolar protein sorting 33A-like protein [Xylariaceae sp. FL0804]